MSAGTQENVELGRLQNQPVDSANGKRDTLQQEAEKFESLSRLAAGIAHHFNNLLAIVVGSASLGVEECPACENMRAILTASERGAELTRQLLAYAGRVPMIYTSVKLTDLVSAAVKSFCDIAPNKVRFDFAFSGEGPFIRADRGQITQMVLALLANAAESVSDGVAGLVTIRTSNSFITSDAAQRRAAAYEVAPGPHVCLEVRDNGNGIDDAAKERVFEPFFTTRSPGRGLGLAYVQGIVRAHKGFVEIDSAPGAGSAFRVFLPAEPAAQVTGGGAPDRAASAPGSATILVVDDEEMLRRMLAAMLKRKGYQVLQAGNGKEALELLAGAAARPSVVVLDIVMPVMGGHEVLPILEARYPEIRVIVASGCIAEDIGGSLQSGVVAGFLQKPFTGEELMEKIGQAMDPAALPLCC